MQSLQKIKINYYVLTISISVICILLIACFHAFELKKQDPAIIEYQKGITKIHQYLSEINFQCRRGQIDLAHNTFLDLKQHWQRLDVFVLVMKETPNRNNYLPSDSLLHLEIQLNNLILNETNQRAIFSVLKEIKGITEQVDLNEMENNSFHYIYFSPVTTIFSATGVLLKILILSAL